MPAFASPDRLYFFFDYISHNAWLAWNKIGAIAEKHDLALEPVPVVFGGLLKAYHQMGPAEVPAKARWMLWNILRKSRLHGIPIAPPATHPFNPLLALRVSCVELPREKTLELTQRLFAAAWMQSRALHEESVVAEVIAEAGLDPAALLAQVQSEAVKARLRENTDAALRVGVFGVPSMRVRNELFWGFDDLEYLEAFLDGRDALGADRSEYLKWFEVQPSVQRKK